MGISAALAMPSDSSFLPSSPAALSADLFLVLVVFLAVIAFWLTPGGLAWSLCRNKSRAKAAIPGPSGLPVLGLVFAFTGKLTHRTLSALAKAFKAESLMSFSVGFTRFVISSSPETARELLNSTAFADRPIKESAYGLLFNRAMGFAPYGDYWRNLRRIAATHLFSPAMVSHFGRFRGEIGQKLVEEIKGEMKANDEVGVKEILHYSSLNNVMKTVFGRSYDFGKNGNGTEVEGLVKEGYELLGMFNWSDHFPLLGWMDLQGVKKRCKNLVGRVNHFVGNLIDEHKMQRGGKDEQDSHDFVHVLLDLEKENSLSDSDMIAVLWVTSFPFLD